MQYQFKNYVLSPKPLQKPHPEIFQGGNSDDARVNGSEVSDCQSIFLQHLQALLTLYRVLHERK
jgi:alkanesulfonate monooxygenase SsuD/methylene tetrahydromethanopterin reductase-like flavin-dependent oxidoreductase (luciferase family)